MEDLLNIKIQHYCEYINTAFENFRQAKFSDAALNGRKCAEAACKIVFFHAYPKKRAEEKIRDKSLKELIMQLVRDALVDRKFINTIEALQIIGNKAAHDNIIQKEQASYALNGLFLLTEYLFTEHLKIKIPSNIDFSTSAKEEKLDEKRTSAEDLTQKVVVQEKIVQMGLDKTSEEELINRLRGIQDADRLKYEELINQKQAALEEQLNELKKLNQPKEEIVTPLEQKPERKNTLLRYGVLSALLLVISGGIIIYFWHSFSKKDAVDEVTAVRESGDTVFVAINKVEVLQDNPQMDFHIEEVLKKEILKRAKRAGIFVKVDFVNFSDIDFENDTAMRLQAEKLRYDAVYWGKLYEMQNDSNEMSIKGALIFDRYWLRNKTVKFTKLTDSTFIKEISDQANTPLAAYCEKVEQNPFADLNRMVAILEKANSFSVENKMAVNHRLSNYLLVAKQNRRALAIADAMLYYYPNDVSGLYIKGNAYRQLLMYDSAWHYLNIAMQVDSVNIDILGSCIRLAIFESDTITAKKYASRLHQIPIARPAVNLYLEEIRSMATGAVYFSYEYHDAVRKSDSCDKLKDYKTAIAWRLKALENTIHKAQVYAKLAEYYYFLHDTVATLNNLNKAWNADSTDLLTVSHHMQLSKAINSLKHQPDYYFNYAVKLFPKNDFMLSEASDYFYKSKDFKRCIEIGLLAEKNLAHNHKIAVNTALADMYTDNLNLARNKFEYLNVLNSNDTLMVYLAQTYFLITEGDPNKPEFKKGLTLIDKAIKMNPKNNLATREADRYLIALGTAMPELLNQSTRSAKHPYAAVPITTLKKAMEKRTGPLGQLFANATTTITGNKDMNTVTVAYSNGSKQSKSYLKTGATSSGSNFNKGNGPPKNAAFPSDSEMIDMVMSNKSLAVHDVVIFLEVQLNFYLNKLERDQTDAETKQVVEKLKSHLALYRKVN